MGNEIQEFTPKEKKRLEEMATDLDKQNLELMQMNINVTPDEDAFCHAFITTRNGPKAVLEAGLVSPGVKRETLWHRARKYMKNPNVMLRIRQLQLPMLYQNQITCQSLINELTAIAFTDITDLIDVDEYEVEVQTGPGKYRKIKRNSITVKPEAIEKLRMLGLGGVIQEIREQRGGSVRLALANKMEAMKELRQILVGDRKQILVGGSVDHKHSHDLSFVDLLNAENTNPEKAKLIKQMYPEEHARKILGDLFDEIVVEDAEFIELLDESNPKLKKEKKSGRKRKKRRKKPQADEEGEADQQPKRRRKKRKKRKSDATKRKRNDQDDE